MPLYTFYPSQKNGMSLGFEAHELANDDDAKVRAVSVLEQHTTAEFVVVWCGERKVFARHRAAPDLEAVLSCLKSEAPGR